MRERALLRASLLCTSLLCASIAIALAVAGVPRADARCARRDLELVSLTPLDRPIARGGGILLALRPTSRGSGSASPPASATIGTVGAGGGALTMVETIAPGLYRVPLASMPPGMHTLRGVLADERRFTIDASALPAAPPAPQLAAVAVANRGRGGRSATATLRTPAPPTVIGVVVLSGGRPISYAPIGDRAAPSLVGFGRCDEWPPGASPPTAGSPIAIRFVDALGQLSPPSETVTSTGE